MKSVYIHDLLCAICTRHDTLPTCRYATFNQLTFIQNVNFDKCLISTPYKHSVLVQNFVSG